MYFKKKKMEHCYNGGNQHRFGNIHEEQPVEVQLITDDTDFKFKGIIRKLNIDKKTPVFTRCEWCGKIVRAKI